MLITIERTVQNNLFTSCVKTEADSLEREYFKAYGEPRVQAGGTLSIPDPSRDPTVLTEGQAILGYIATAGTVQIRVDVSEDLSDIISGDSLVIEDVVEEPLLNGTHEIIAIDDVGSSGYKLLEIENPGIAVGNEVFLQEVTEGLVQIGAQSDNQAVAGYVDDTVETTIFLKAGTPIDLTVVNPGDTISIADVTLEPALNGNHIVISADDGTKTVVVATVAPAESAFNPFTIPDPQGDATATPQDILFSFPVQTLFVASSSPMCQSLNSSSDPNAESKVAEWAEDLKNKIVTAMTELKQEPNPAINYPVVETFQV